MSWKLVFDLLVIGAYFAAIVTIGLSFRGRSGNVNEFSLGGRSIPWWAVLASILAAEISAATFLGAPGEGYAKRNWTYAQLVIGTILARILVSVIFIPAYYRHGVVSIYEFLGTRFGDGSRRTASATFLVTRVLAMGSRLYVSAIIVVLAFEAVYGTKATPDQRFWLYAAALVFVSLLTALYTAVGGIRAVIWTDFIQVSVLFAALGFSVWYLLGRLDGGWEAVTGHLREPLFLDWLTGEHAERGGVPFWRRILTEEYSVYTALIGSTFVTMATHGIDQDAVQRMLTAKNRRQSMLATIASGLVDLPVVCAFVFIGILLSLYYQQQPNPDLPAEGREVFPYFILHEMPGGIRGLVAAGILATAMGSLSTALNAMATSFARDFLFRGREESMTDSARVRALRWSTLLFAGLVIVVGLFTAWHMAHHPHARIIPLVLGILGFTFGSVLGVFLVAIFTKSRGNDFGNILGMACGFLVVVFFSNGSLQEAVGFTRIENGGTVPALILAFPWRVTLGTLVTVAIALCFRTPSAARAAHEAAPVSA